MYKRIFWINLGLLCIIVLLSLNVYRVWRSGQQKISRNRREEKTTSKGSVKAQKFPRFPSYPLPSGFPVYQPPRAQAGGSPGGYRAIPPPPGQEASKVPGRTPFRQPRYIPPPGYQGKVSRNRAGGYFYPFPKRN